MRTRHNVGFLVVDALAVFFHIEIRCKKFDVLYGERHGHGSHVCLCKPQTYMNLSGAAVKQFCDFYKIAGTDLLVAHDDLDLPLGRLKFSRGRGAAGHRGVTSIIEAFGTTAFDRLRIGIGRPPRGVDPTEYVLQPFGIAEEEGIRMTVEQAATATRVYLERGIEWAMGQFH